VVVIDGFVELTLQMIGETDSCQDGKLARGNAQCAVISADCLRITPERDSREQNNQNPIAQFPVAIVCLELTSIFCRHAPS
jgi:hypothetical protein